MLIRRLALRDAAEPRVDLRPAHELGQRAAAVRRRAVARPQQARRRHAWRASANVASLIRSTTTTWRISPGRGLARGRSARRGERDARGQENREQGDEADRPDHQVDILTEACNETKGSTARRPRRAFLDELLEARRALERGEAGRRSNRCSRRRAHQPAAAGSRDRSRRADEPAQQKIAPSRACPPRLAWDDCALRIATLGDVLLDVVVLLGGAARAGRRRARLEPGGSRGPGGQRRGLGGRARRRGALHREAGRRRGRRARRAGARRRAASSSSGRRPRAPRASSSRSCSDGDRSLASDRGVAPSLAPEELDAGWLACDVLHLSGYALLREPIAAAALLAARLAREQGARVSVDVAAWTEIRSYGPVRFRELLDELAPDVLFATEAEWELLGGAYLTAPVGVLKRGARGCTVFTAGREARLRRRRRGGRRPDGRRATRSPPASSLGGSLERRRGAGTRRGRPLRRESRVAAVRPA